MTTHTQNGSHGAESDRALDSLLTAWATRHALAPARAEAIRQAVLFMPDAPAAELTGAWWQRFFGTVATTVNQASDVRRFLQLPA